MSIGSETWTITRRDAHKGRGTNEIFKTAIQTDNKGQSNEMYHPKQTENRQRGRRYESIKEKLVRSTERNGHESSTKTGFLITAQGTTERKKT
jgi:hypothetical protein